MGGKGFIYIFSSEYSDKKGVGYGTRDDSS